MKPVFTIVYLKGYICNKESRKDISVGFSRPFEFRVAWCYKSESLAGMVAYVSKHQSLDIFEFRNIEFKQIFQKQIWRNDLGRLNWQHVIFTLFSHIGLVEKPLTTRCKIKRIKWTDREMLKKIVWKRLKGGFHDNIYKGF